MTFAHNLDRARLQRALVAAEKATRVKSDVNVLSVDEILSSAIPWDRSSLCGIYFLIRDGVVVYVGQSINIQRRIEEHLQLGVIVFDAWNHIKCDLCDLDAYERAYLDAFTPEMNNDNLTRKAKGLPHWGLGKKRSRRS